MIQGEKQEGYKGRTGRIQGENRMYTSGRQKGYKGR